MKVVRFDYFGLYTGYRCSEPDPMAGEYVRADVARALLEALKPFASFLDAAEAAAEAGDIDPLCDDRVIASVVPPGGLTTLRVADLRRAAKALNKALCEDSGNRDGP